MRTGTLLEQDIPKGCWAGPRGMGGQAMPGHACCGQQGQASGAGQEGDRPKLGLQEGMEGKYTQRVNHCLPWGCDTLGRLAGGRSIRGPRHTLTASTAHIQQNLPQFPV